MADGRRLTASEVAARETAGSACSRARRCRPVGSDVDNLDRPNARDPSATARREGVQMWTGPTRARRPTVRPRAEDFRASFARAREASNCSATLVDSSSRRRSRHHGRTRRGDEYLQLHVSRINGVDGGSNLTLRLILNQVPRFTNQTQISDTEYMLVQFMQQ